MKIVRLESCQGCPYRDFHPSWRSSWCRKEDRLISFESASFPYWCPLDDAEEADQPARGPVDKLLKILKDLIASRFFGIVELRFEDGKVVNIRKTENIKP